MQRIVKRQSVTFQPVENLPFFHKPIRERGKFLILVTSSLIKFRFLALLSHAFTSFRPFWLFGLLLRVPDANEAHC